MNKILVAILVICALPAVASAEMKMQNANPSPAVVPEHVTQNSDPSPDPVPEHVMQNSNPAPASASAGSTEKEPVDIQHLMKKK